MHRSLNQEVQRDARVSLNSGKSSTIRRVAMMKREEVLTPTSMPATMKHLGILAHRTEGAALCFRAFCQEGFGELGPHDHPDVTLDCISMARSMIAWDEGDYTSIRATLGASVARLARAGAD